MAPQPGVYQMTTLKLARSVRAGTPCVAMFQ